MTISVYGGGNKASTSQEGKTSFITEFGELTTGMRIDDISVTFQYGVSPKSTIDLSTGTGSVSSVGSDGAVQCGAGIGTGRLESLDPLRYRAGHESMTMITHDQTALQDGVDVLHGLVNDEDGLAIGSQGTEVGVWFIEDSNENFIPQSSWNLDRLDGTGPSGFTLDITMRNLFAISFGYLSIAPIRFYIHVGNKGWVQFHNIILSNTQNEGHLKNPTLPISCIVRRLSGSGPDVQVKAGSWRAGTIGPEHQVNASDRWFSFTTNRVNLPVINTTTNPEMYHNVFTLKSSDLFNGRHNHVRSELAIISFVVDGNKAVEFSSHVNGALVGEDAFTDINTGNSVMSYSMNGTVEGNLAGGATVIGKDSDRRTDVRGTGLYVRAGETLTLGVRGLDGAAFTGDLSGSIRWVEEF